MLLLSYYCKIILAHDSSESKHIFKHYTGKYFCNTLPPLPPPTPVDSHVAMVDHRHAKHVMNPASDRDETGTECVATVLQQRPPHAALDATHSVFVHFLCIIMRFPCVCVCVCSSKFMSA